MSRLISYAQNNEDVVLHRALRHVEEGFYIDVGAFDPAYDSVTKLFYDLGWSGINIEPLGSMYDRLVAERPRDQNLNIALSDSAGEVTFYSVEETGLSTLDAKSAEKARSEGSIVEETRTEVRTLADVCRTSPVGEIHFLKIDVEGAERRVLSGADLAAFRPWIIVVEATTPGTSDRVDDEWRPLLEEAGYQPVLFDGLNLFFLSSEHPELRPSLLAPANVVDDFIPIQHHAALLRLGSLLPDGEDCGDALADGSPRSLRGLIAWHGAFARENQERVSAERIAWHRADAEAEVRRSMEGTVAWHRADAEAEVRRSMEGTVAWNRADAEAEVRRSMEGTIAWHRADAEAAVRRSMEDTVAWHRADAAERAYKCGMEVSDGRLRDAVAREAEARQMAEDGMAALRRLRLEQAARHAAAEAEFHDVRAKHAADVAELQRCLRDLDAQKKEIFGSTSWRLTRPIRLLKHVFRSISRIG